MVYNVFVVLLGWICMSSHLLPYAVFCHMFHCIQGLLYMIMLYLCPRWRCILVLFLCWTPLINLFISECSDIYISGQGFKSHSGQLSIATSKNPSVVNTICIDSLHYNVITCARLHLTSKCGDWRRQKTEIKPEHCTKRWNWSSCTKLALRASCSHGLIAQSVRAS